MEVFTLTAKSRANIWAHLNDAQLDVLRKYTLYASKSQLFNDIYAQGARWRFVGVNIDYHWEQANRNLKKFPHYYCQCGRVVKNQYVLESMTAPHQRLYLGVTHFAQELGIPDAVASEVKKRVNEIQMYMDEVLTYYKWGRRFPAERYALGLQLGAFKEESGFTAKMADFARADFPLFHLDQQRLERLVTRAQNRVTTRDSGASVAPISTAKLQVTQKKKVTAAESAPTGDTRQLIAHFCGCRVIDLRRQFKQTLAIAALEEDLFLLALATDCGIEATGVQLHTLLAHLKQKSLSQETIRALTMQVTRGATQLRREQPLLMRLLLHNRAAAGTKSGRAQMRRILTQNAANQQRKHHLRTEQIARYQTVLAERVATQFARIQAGGADASAKFSLDWQYTLQRLQERTLYEVGAGRLG